MKHEVDQAEVSELEVLLGETSGRLAAKRRCCSRCPVPCDESPCTGASHVEAQYINAVRSHI